MCPTDILTFKLNTSTINILAHEMLAQVAKTKKGKDLQEFTDYSKRP